jgi:hypothetical protein
MVESFPTVTVEQGECHYGKPFPQVAKLLVFARSGGWLKRTSEGECGNPLPCIGRKEETFFLSSIGLYVPQALLIPHSLILLSRVL